MINQRKLMIKQNIACELEPNAQSLIYTLTHTHKKNGGILHFYTQNLVA